MIQMVLNECPLCLTDCFLDSMQLLGKVKTGATSFDHLNDTFQMTVGALQALYDLRMGFVAVGMFAHGIDPIPRRGYNNQNLAAR